MRSMNREKFLQECTYAVELDWARNGSPASWAGPDEEQVHRLWETEDSSITLPFKPMVGKSPNIISAVSHDHTLLAVAYGSTVLVYDTASKELRATFRGPSEPFRKLFFIPLLGRYEHQLVTTSATVGGTESQILFWHLDSDGHRPDTEPPLDSTKLSNLALSAIKPALAESHGLEADSPFLDHVFHDFEASLDVLDSKLRTRKLPTLTGYTPSYNRHIEHEIFSPDCSRMLYAIGNKTTQHGMRPDAELPRIVVRDLASDTNLHTLGGHTDAIMWVAFSPDGRSIASASWDQHFRIWDVATGPCKHIIGPTGGQNWAGSWSHDSKHVILSGYGHSEETDSRGPNVRVYDAETGAEVARFRHEHLKDRATHIDWCPNKDIIAISAGVNIWIWRPFDDTIVCNFRIKIEDRMHQSFAAIMGLGWVDGGRKLLALTGSGAIEVWDRIDNVKWRFERPHEVRSLAYSLPTAIHFLEETDTVVRVDDDGVVRFWHLTPEVSTS